MGLIIIILQANVTVGTADAFLLARAKLFIYLEVSVLKEPKPLGNVDVYAICLDDATESTV